jgi:hypothetical protein
VLLFSALYPAVGNSQRNCRQRVRRQSRKDSSCFFFVSASFSIILRSPSLVSWGMFFETFFLSMAVLTHLDNPNKKTASYIPHQNFIFLIPHRKICTCIILSLRTNSFAHKSRIFSKIENSSFGFRNHLPWRHAFFTFTSRKFGDSDQSILRLFSYAASTFEAI